MSTMSALLDRANAVTTSPRWDLEKRFPVVADRAEGCHIWDADGKRYIDYTSCSGAAPLGVGHPAVIEAAIGALRTGGIVPSTLSAARIQTAEQLLPLFPFADRVRFFRTGSCATTAAARICRVHTGRSLLLTSGFHGWHDWHLQSTFGGLPNRDPETIDFGYDLQRLADLLAERWNEVAGVFITPEVNFFPHAYHVELAQLVRGHGCLLILDEVMTGFRYQLGGYAVAADIQPDLITLSKGLANGMALSAVVGRAEVFDGAEPAYLGYTYQREVTPFAAAAASLNAFRTEDPIGRMHDVGRALISGLNDLFERTSVPAIAFSWPSMFRVLFGDNEIGESFYAGLLRRGVLMEYGGVHMISAATSAEDIALTLSAAEDSLTDVLRTARPTLNGTGLTDTDAHELAARAFGATAETAAKWWPGYSPSNQ
ncbi:aminotransferase class III-fold pyridoxal phosphate-dependent enzyme [Nocardia arthritidis]|uniref:Aminotransferase class III-fold pyridoxal phosphate-dependent enzyme n=1 Tax=Nocardia arthritidis TaxID=228602 RepID=A0A6G9YL72_9NOCA|nr:aminotransferase class III-fold pyridoxal phosphate-dependent enzyme [Nocardia arthritidis]QIS13962.1 aminotransferase class III-fold pyridoxal phosphate-dependent enzyme [Nocardia arthritidis]